MKRGDAPGSQGDAAAHQTCSGQPSEDASAGAATPGDTDADELDDRSENVNIEPNAAPRRSTPRPGDLEHQAMAPPEPQSAASLRSSIAAAENLGQVDNADPGCVPASGPGGGVGASLLRLLHGRAWGSSPSLRSERSRRVAIPGIGLLLLASTTGFLAHENARLHDELHATAQRQAAQLEALRSDLRTERDATSQVGGRVSRLESEADGQLDTAVIAQTVAPSVYEVQAGDAVGTAWVAASSSGTSELVTNAHVVADVVDAGQRAVTLVRGTTTLPATIERVDRDADLAVLSVRQVLPVLPRATEEVAIGDPLMVIGSALGLEGSVSSGIVSAIRPADGRNYIQLSAPVNFGNSGGPVVDRHGQVIGVTVIKVVGDGAEGLAFAIPIATVCQTVISCEPTTHHVNGPIRAS